jgi:nonsense-mediated mRNA decay protein 3
MIPCCECGTPILPNEANQCSTCLAQQFNLSDRLQRGPGGSDKIIIHQCRKCRRYARTEKHFENAAIESPQLLAICLKHIPALAPAATPRLHLVDAKWIWTEPHSMRFKVHLTVRTELLEVQVQQRVAVQLTVQFKMCPDCNREYTNREWHAVVQLRQRRVGDAPKRGLAALEMAISKNADIRKHVLRIDTAKDGFDFYFLSINHATAFGSFLQRVAPMRIKQSKKLVSQDYKNNTANMKHTVQCDMVPLCRDDLIVIHKSAAAALAGRLALVTRMQSVIHLVDASPKRDSSSRSTTRGAITTGGQSWCTELGPESYYKNEKYYTVLQASHRLIRFVVLDVELLFDPSSVSDSMFKRPASGMEKYAVARTCK